MRLRQSWRAWLLRRCGVTCEGRVLLGANIFVRKPLGTPVSSPIRLGAAVDLQQGVILDAAGGAIAIGAETYVGPYSVLYGHGGLTIGSHALIGPHCQLLSSNHTVPPMGHLIRYEPDLPLPTQIGDDVWLGAGVTVLGGVTIGEGCVVGAGAVVTHDLPPGSIAYGVPATVRSRRPAS